MRQVGDKREPRSHLPPQPRRQRPLKDAAAVLRTCGAAYAQEASGDGVELAGVELVEFALRINEHAALERDLGERIEAQAVVGEVVEDLESEEKARTRDVAVPVEDGLVDDFHLAPVAVGVQGAGEVMVLELGQGVGDFDDLEFGAGVDLRVGIADVVEDVEHEGAVAGSHLVDEEVMVGVERQLVVCDQVTRNGFTVVRPEEFCGCMPKLSRVI